LWKCHSPSHISNHADFDEGKPHLSLNLHAYSYPLTEPLTELFLLDGSMCCLSKSTRWTELWSRQRFLPIVGLGGDEELDGVDAKIWM